MCLESESLIFGETCKLQQELGTQYPFIHSCRQPVRAVVLSFHVNSEYGLESTQHCLIVAQDIETGSGEEVLPQKNCRLVCVTKTPSLFKVSMLGRYFSWTSLYLQKVVCRIFPEDCFTTFICEMVPHAFACHMPFLLLSIGPIPVVHHHHSAC